MIGTTLARFTLACLAVLALTSPPAFSQRTSFNPAISLGASAYNNIGFSGADEQNDTAFLLGAILPVRSELKQGQLTFSYSTQFSKFDKFEALDNLSHNLQLALSIKPAPRSFLSLSLSHLDDQSQPEAQSVDSVDLFLAQRTDRQLSRLNLSFGSNLSRRWTWTTTLGAGVSRFKRIDDFLTPAGGLLEPDDRTESQGSLAISRNVSSKTAIGMSLGYTRFDLDAADDETTRTLALTINRNLGDRFALGFSVGGFRRERDTTAPILQDDSQDGINGTLTVSRTLRRSTLALTAFHSPSSGGTGQGTSTDSTLALALASVDARTWDWSFHVRWAYRDPTDPLREEQDSLAAGFSLERKLGRRIGFRVSPTYFDQSDSESRLVVAGGLSLVWYPLERTRLGKGG